MKKVEFLLYIFFFWFWLVALKRLVEEGAGARVQSSVLVGVSPFLPPTPTPGIPVSGVSVIQLAKSRHHDSPGSCVPGGLSCGKARVAEIQAEIREP